MRIFRKIPLNKIEHKNIRIGGDGMTEDELKDKIMEAICKDQLPVKVKKKKNKKTNDKEVQTQEKPIDRNMIAEILKRFHITLTGKGAIRIGYGKLNYEVQISDIVLVIRKIIISGVARGGGGMLG
jgi:hypothetical protein